jgi:glucosyl-3-phosphoglycerate synthase
MKLHYHFTDFLPLKRLCRLKKESGSTIDLVIPTYNESATIGGIVADSRKYLMEEVPLLDNIIIIDGASTDATRELARKAGARVYRCGSIPPRGVFPRGKGVNLWKGLFAADGDIIVCIDGDIVDFEPRFIYGLAGALLQNKKTVLSKAHYRRHLLVNNYHLDNLGGRITEILVRPVLSAFFPPLATVRQPLSGEYAFRRKVAEQLPFFSGYGVEIGMLIDICMKYGRDSIAEVDMDVRYHRNRSLQELSRASFGIFHAMLKKMKQYGLVSTRRGIHRKMVCMTRGAARGYTLREIELPPKAFISKSRTRGAVAGKNRTAARRRQKDR